MTKVHLINQSYFLAVKFTNVAKGGLYSVTARPYCHFGFLVDQSVFELDLGPVASLSIG